MRGPTAAESHAPAGVEEAAALMRQVAADGARVRFRGGGTKLSWGRPVDPVDVEITTGGLDNVVEHNAGDFTAVVESGVRLADLQRRLRQSGQRFALDPPRGDGEEATIGGIAAAADAGPLRHRYGAARDLVLGVTVALPGGSVAKSGGKVIKNVAGYDLSKLYVGSLGTLGLILRVALRLHPLPEPTMTSLGTSPDADTVARAALAVAREPLEAESLDVRWEAGLGTVLVRLGGRAAEDLAGRAASALSGAGMENTTLIADDEGHWQHQRASQAGREKLVVRVSSLASRLSEVLRAAAGHDASLVGRAAHGVYWLTLDTRDEAEAVQGVRAIRRELAPSSCVLLEAPESVRRSLDVWDLDGHGARRLMVAVKRRFDPGHHCNPGLFAEDL